MIHVQSRKATKEDVCLVHDESHWNRMNELPNLPEGENHDVTTGKQRIDQNDNIGPPDRR